MIHPLILVAGALFVARALNSIAGETPESIEQREQQERARLEGEISELRAKVQDADNSEQVQELRRELEALKAGRRARQKAKREAAKPPAPNPPPEAPAGDQPSDGE